jgi:regulator of sigma E protease
VDQRDTSKRDGDVTQDGSTSIGRWVSQNAISLLVTIGVVVFVCIKLDPITVALVALGLGLVIFIHELGHFVAAKWCDVHVETFSIGFGPPLPGCCFQYGETVYQIALFPLGGYVKMVGEGAEEEGEEDPRSFKNKTVGQRMLIISAGVVMNVLLAAVCFVGVYTTAGVDRPAGVIGSVDSGSPSWQKGLRPGVELTRIGSTEQPYFDDVRPEVMHWKPGQPIPVTYRDFAAGRESTVETEVVPRKNQERGLPMIGIGPAHAATLLPPNRRKVPPVEPDSPAASAQPPLRNGDQVVGTTDPDQPAGDFHADKTGPLPDDPRAPGTGRRDYFELAHRLHRLAGKEMVLLVRHEGTADDAKPEAVHIGPSFHTAYGLRLAMGPITAVRENSPAAKAGIQLRSGQDPGDTLTSVEVTGTDGAIRRFMSAPGKNADHKVHEEILDPARLPDQLREWAAQKGAGAKSVKLSLRRQAGHNENGQETVVELPWDDSWQNQPSSPSSENAPQAIDGLGLAYSIKTQIADIERTPWRANEPAFSPAEHAVVAKNGKPLLNEEGKPQEYPLKKDDVIKTARFFGRVDGELKSTDVKLGPDQGAYAQWMAHEGTYVRQLGLVVQRGDSEPVEVLIQGEEDKSWPQAARGLRFDGDMRLEKADSLAQALVLGVHHTGRLIYRIYQNLGAMLDGRISFPKNASGPIDIAAASYNIAGENLQLFVLFIGMISVNLAVINFLPIPVLDGGHMVFLIYEKLRGRPAPEAIRVAATFVGLAMIASLMLFVIFLDVQKRL